MKAKPSRLLAESTIPSTRPSCRRNGRTRIPVAAEGKTPQLPHQSEDIHGFRRLFLLLRLGTLDLRRSAEGLLSVLALLACRVEETTLAVCVSATVLPSASRPTSTQQVLPDEATVMEGYARCCLLARSALVARPTRTNRY